MKYKKYILFAFNDYYPQGGLDDIEDSYDTMEEALFGMGKLTADHTQIVDRDTWEVLETGNRCERERIEREKQASVESERMKECNQMFADSHSEIGASS